MKSKTVHELKALIDQGADHQLIDVREQNEYDFANIGGELIPVGSILNHHDQISMDVPVIIHCRSGARSADAVAALEKAHGFDNLYNLEGGILAWSREVDPSVPQY